MSYAAPSEEKPSQINSRRRPAMRWCRVLPRTYGARWRALRNNPCPALHACSASYCPAPHLVVLHTKKASTCPLSKAGWLFEAPLSSRLHSQQAPQQVSFPSLIGPVFSCPDHQALLRQASPCLPAVGSDKQAGWLAGVRCVALFILAVCWLDSKSPLVFCLLAQVQPRVPLSSACSERGCCTRP